MGKRITTSSVSFLLITGAALGGCGIEAGADAEENLGNTEQALSGSKIATTLVAAPGWATPANLLDGSTATKSTNGAATASIELSLGGNYTLTGVRVAEDNAGAQNVDAFGIQCWNGSSYDTELFRENNTPIAVPGFNEHAITGTTCTTSKVKVNLYNDAALEAMEVEIYGTPAAVRPIYLDVANGPGGSMFPSGQFTVAPGSTVNFHFDPDPGYRLAKICTPNYDQCQTLHDTEYSLKNITGSDRIVWATFEPIPDHQEELPVKVLASTFATPAAVVDADVTNSKSLGNANNLASIDLQLDGFYQLNRVQVFEDNGSYEVDQYGVQCWNGFGWEPELFRVNSTNLVKPTPNQYSIAGNSCMTDRVRVNFYNNGVVEVFGLKLFGSYRNVLHTNQGAVALGVHNDSSGAEVDTQIRYEDGVPYMSMLSGQSSLWTTWIYDEARPGDWYGTLTRSTAAFTSAYVRNCQTGVWTDIYATSYAPTDFPFQVTGPSAFRVSLPDKQDVVNGFMDLSYDCPDETPVYANVLYNGTSTKVLADGFSHFAYVVTQK